MEPDGHTHVHTGHFAQDGVGTETLDLKQKNLEGSLGGLSSGFGQSMLVLHNKQSLCCEEARAPAPGERNICSPLLDIKPELRAVNSPSVFL